MEKKKTNYQNFIEEKQKNEIIYINYYHSSSRMTNSNIRKIINAFVNNVDISKEYSLKELDKVLSTSYKENNVKRLPTAYNIYIKEKMAELKSSNPSLTAKELLQMAASGWAEHKKQHPTSQTHPQQSESTEQHIQAPPTSPQLTPEASPSEEPKIPLHVDLQSVPSEPPGAPKKPAKKSKAAK